MGRLQFITQAVLLLLGLSLIACRPRPEAVAPSLATPVAVAPAIATPKQELAAKATWEVAWQTVLNASQKEGQVVVYTSAPGEVRTKIVPLFTRKFGIKLEMIVARGGELSTKLLAERRAGLYTVDVYVAGSSTPILQLKPVGALDSLESALILPEVTDPKAWYGGELLWVDSQRTLLSFISWPSQNIAINTQLVKPGEIAAYKELLNPKWKGKIIMNDPTVAGAGNKIFRVLGFYLMDVNFFRELAKQEPLITRDLRLQMDWLAHGKYPVAFAPSSGIMTEFKRAGAPVRYVPPSEGTYLSASDGNVSLINRAPHPNAARVFINWLLSREGGIAFSEAYGAQSARLDVPAAELGIDPDRIRVPGVKYFLEGDKEEFLLKEPEQTKIAREIFGHLIK